MTKIVSTRFGSMRIIDADNVISRSLSLYGEWAIEELNLLAQLISPGMFVLDVGAYVGTHTLAFSGYVGEKGRVYSFEPRKEIYAILVENIAINDCKNVVALNMGLAEKERFLHLQSVDINQEINFGGLTLDVKEGEPDSDTYQVRVSTIDGLNFEKTDVIKLDVEGMERLVLDGATKTILRDRPIIFAECNSLNAGNEVLEFGQSEKYATYAFLASAYNSNNFNSAKKNIFGAAKELALILIPQENIVKTLQRVMGVSLLPISNLEDLVLPLLHKPQYAYEVLAHTAPYSLLGLEFPSPALVVCEEQIANLNHAVSKRETQIVTLGQNIADRDDQIATLTQGLTECDKQIVTLGQDIADRDDQIATLTQGLTECDKQIVTLGQDIADRDDQIATLTQGLTECDKQIVTLNQGITERDVQNEKIIRSKSWLITKPVRWFGRVFRGEFEGAFAPFKKMMGLDEITVKHQTSNSQISTNSSEASITVDPIKPTHPTAVIVPVYRGVEMTKRCIMAAMTSVLAVPGSRLLAINDASPDEGMQEMLEQLSLQWPDGFQVLKNEKNLGFVRTVNRGLAYFSQYDVVLLNSDVVVPKDWLCRLIDEAYSRGNVGTVTPFSNNATICSFPYFLQENAQPFDLDVDFVDSVFRRDKLPCIEAPTGVGFCMYIRRACLDKIGYLNEERFGRGYGEENDLCQRALKGGWLNLISPNIYAFHEGGVSFSTDKQALVDRAMRVIEELHSNYHDDVKKFIKDDPVKFARVTRYAQLLSATPIPKVLHISHSVGGGVKQHIDELVEYYGQRIAHILLAPHRNRGDISISLGINPHADKLIFNLPDGYAELVELLKAVGISAVHFHHTHGLDTKILQLPVDLGVAYLLTVHDFYWLGGNPTLTDEAGKYPGFYSDSQHNPLYPLPNGMAVHKWQEPLRTFIEGADCVIFPSNSTKTLFENVYNPANPVVAPHVELQLDINTLPSKFIKKSSYNIGALGALGREKGADLLEGIATNAKNAGLSFNFKLIGYAYRPLNRVEATGAYETKDLKELIRRHELDIILFTAQWPETYSYTLSYALDSGLPIIAPNVGAFPERLSGRTNTMLFDYLKPLSELLKQINEFAESLSVGNVVKAPVFENDKSEYHFYEGAYLSVVSRDLDVNSANDLKQVRLKHSIIIRGDLGGKNSSWREILVHILWRLHMNPYLRKISRNVPKRATQAVRRSLSKGNSHDIARGFKGK